MQLHIYTIFWNLRWQRFFWLWSLVSDHWKTPLLIVCQLESILGEQGIYSLTSNLNFFLR